MNSWVSCNTAAASWGRPSPARTGAGRTADASAIRPFLRETSRGTRSIGLQVGVAGELAVVPDWTPDLSAPEALGACLGQRKLGRARRGEDGVWAAWHDNDRDTCVAAWAAAHLTEMRIDRLAVIRTE